MRDCVHLGNRKDEAPALLYHPAGERAVEGAQRALIGRHLGG